VKKFSNLKKRIAHFFYNLNRKGRQKKLTRYKKIKPSSIEKIGSKDGDMLLSLWYTQKKPRKVYIGGYRFHHGLFGLGLSIWGNLNNDDYLKGMGNTFMKDDIEDSSDWFNFKK